MPASRGSNEKATGRGWYQEIDRAGDAELNASDAPAFANVSGSVLFEGTTSVPKGASLRISNPVTGESFTSAISDKGQADFSTNSVRPGRYNVSLGTSEGFFLRKLSASGARLTGRTLEIGASSSVRIVGVATRGMGQVGGTLCTKTSRT